MGGFSIEGHRGARGLWPENTLGGFRQAAALGVEALELDVMLTADGAVVVTHDAILNPDLTRGADGLWLVASGLAVAHMSAADLGLFDVGRMRPGSAGTRAFPHQTPADGARIPLLAEVFAAIASYPVVVDVEFKTDPDAPGQDPIALADAVLALAVSGGWLGRLAVRSFDWRGLRHLAARDADLPMTWLTNATAVSDVPVYHAIVRAAGHGAARAAWGPHHASLTREAVIQAHALGLRVVPWTVNAVADMARLVGWGVDGICTDYPDRALRLRSVL